MMGNNNNLLNQLYEKNGGSLDQIIASKESLQWQLNSSSTTEGQTFYLTTKEGSFLLLQMVYSTMSFSPSVQITARFYGSDGSRVNETLSCYGSSMKLSSDKLSASCEQMSIQAIIEESDSSSNDAMGKKRMMVYKISFKSAPKMIIEFTLTDEQAIEMYPGGKILFKDTNNDADGYVSSRFIPKGQVEGSCMINGKLYDLEGYGTFVHAVQHYPQCCGRWNFLALQGEKDGMMIYQYEMPDGYDYQHGLVSQACLVRDNKVFSFSLMDQCQVKHVVRDVDPDSGYAYPKKISIQYNGKLLYSSSKSSTGSNSSNNKDQDVLLSMEIPLVHALDKVDILSELPFLVRKIIQTFITKPFVFSWLEDEIVCQVKVMEKDQLKEEFELKGKMFIESTILLEMDVA